MKVLLADDHGLFREGFAMLTSRIFPQSTIKQVQNWTEAHEGVRCHTFDLALLDLFMPGKGLWKEELSIFLHNSPSLPVCVISASNAQADIQAVLKLGVKGYLHKRVGMEEVRLAITQLINGGSYLPLKLQNNYQSKYGCDVKLTNRQKEISELIVEGISNREIAKQLELTEATIKRHIYNIFKLLGVKNRTEAAQLIRQSVFLPTEEG